MSLLNFAREEVVTTGLRASVLEAAELLRARNVGCLVVVEGGSPAASSRTATSRSGSSPPGAIRKRLPSRR